MYILYKCNKIKLNFDTAKPIYYFCLKNYYLVLHKIWRYTELKLLCSFLIKKL